MTPVCYTQLMTTEHSDPNPNEHISTKLCVQCGEMKPLSEFLRRTGRRAGGLGRRGTCRDCRRGRQSVESLPAKGAARGQQASAAKHAEARAAAASADAVAHTPAAMETSAAMATPAAAQAAAPPAGSRRRRGGRAVGDASPAAASAASSAASSASAPGAQAAGAVGSAAGPGRTGPSGTGVPDASAAASAPSAGSKGSSPRTYSAAAAPPSPRSASTASAAAPGPGEPARKPPGRGRNRRPAQQPRLLAEPPKRSTHDPADASYLRTTASGFIRMRGKTDNGRRWYQEVELELAQILVREGAAVVVNRSTIRRLYSNKEFRKLILTRDNYVCRFCGKYGDTIDHELPRAKGGHTTPANCVCACYECNQLKANRDVDEFRSTLE